MSYDDDTAYMHKKYVDACPKCARLMYTEAEKHFEICKYCTADERGITDNRALKELRNEYNEVLGNFNQIDEEIEDE